MFNYICECWLKKHIKAGGQLKNLLKISCLKLNESNHATISCLERPLALCPTLFSESKTSW